MAIRVQHDAGGAALRAAYAGGQGKTRQRQQKYAMTLYRDQRNIQARAQLQYQGFKYQEALQGDRDRAVQGRFDAAQNAMQGRFDVQQEGMQGRFEAGQKATQGRFEAQNTRRANEAAFAALPPIPDYADPEMRADLTKLRGGIRELLSGKHDLTDIGVLDKLTDAMDSYRNKVAGLKPPSLADRANQGTIYFDPKDQRFHDDPGEGRVPYGADGKPLDMETAESKATAEEAKKTEDVETKRQAAIATEARSILKTDSDFKKDHKGKTDAEKYKLALEYAERLYPKPSTSEQRISPDGKYVWDGTKWVEK